MLEARSIVLPSIASNDSPCTALSVLYHEDGAFDEYKFFSKSPDMVLVDTDVILDSPVRFIIAVGGSWAAAASVCYSVVRSCVAAAGVRASCPIVSPGMLDGRLATASLPALNLAPVPVTLVAGHA